MEPMKEVFKLTGQIRCLIQESEKRKRGLLGTQNSQP